jgi:hypothetical protein
MHLTMASRMLVRVRSRIQREWNCRSSQLQLLAKPNLKERLKMAGDKADLPDLPHPGGVHHHHKAFFDRHTYQHDAHPVRISNARSGSDSPPLRSPSPSPSQRSHARTLASTGSRNRRGSGSSPGGVPILAQVGVQPGRRALGRSSHAQTRRSLTRACRALALVALSRLSRSRALSLVRSPGSSGSSPPPFAGRFCTIPGRTERIATPRL